MARDFDGVDDRIDIADADDIDITGDLTLAAWLYWTASGDTWEPIAVKGNSVYVKYWNYGLIVYSDGDISAGFGDGTYYRLNIPDTNISQNQWKHVAAVFSGTDTVDMYLDGVKQTDNYSGTATSKVANAYALSLGKMPSLNQRLAGRLADFVLYDVAVSADEVAALASGVSPNMIRRNKILRYLPLWGVSSPEPDLSGNQGNGTVTGAVKADHAPVGPYVVPFSPRVVG